MSEARFERTLTIAAPAETMAAFFADREAWFRLNPEWEVLALDAENLKVRYERSEAEAEYRVDFRRVAGADLPEGRRTPRSGGPEQGEGLGEAEHFGEDGGDCLLDGPAPRTVHLSWQALGAGRTRVTFAEQFAAPQETRRLAELNLWADAAAGYLRIAARRDRRGRFMRWLLDRAWLKLSPTARRVGLLVIAMEALALLLFIAVLLIYRFTG